MNEQQKPPSIDASDFELELELKSKMIPFGDKKLVENLDNFKSLILKIIDELGLTEHIDHLFVSGADRKRAELGWKGDWPSRILYLKIYVDDERYMDEKLIRHEFGHEADRHNSKMDYHPRIDKYWKDQGGLGYDLFELIVNISLDSRLGKGGLGKQKRFQDFEKFLGKYPKYSKINLDFFKETWNHPPLTWPEMNALTKKHLDH